MSDHTSRMKVKGLLITGHEPPPTPPPHTAVYTTRITNTLPVWLHPKIHLQLAYLWASQLIKKILTTKKKKKNGQVTFRWATVQALKGNPLQWSRAARLPNGTITSRCLQWLFSTVLCANLKMTLCGQTRGKPDTKYTISSYHWGGGKKIVLETTSGISCLLRLPFAL